MTRENAEGISAITTVSELYDDSQGMDFSRSTRVCQLKGRSEGLRKREKSGSGGCGGFARIRLLNFDADDCFWKT